MYKLYNVKGWGSMAPHFVLEEMGLAYENVWMTPEQVRQPAFREISPLGFIPALGLDDGRAIFKSAAIVAFLDRRPSRQGPGAAARQQSTMGSFSPGSLS